MDDNGPMSDSVLFFQQGPRWKKGDPDRDETCDIQDRQSCQAPAYQARESALAHTLAHILDGTTKAEDNSRLRTEVHNAAKICHRRGVANYGARLGGPVQHRGCLQ